MGNYAQNDGNNYRN